MLYLSGLAGLYANLVRPNGALILMYHSVVDDSIASYIDPNNSVTVDEFETQLRWLKKHCHVISFAQMLECVTENRPFPEKSVVITFDDGYRDNLTLAAPLLEKYQCPATLFLCTGYVERVESQWVDQLYTAFRFRTRHTLELPGGGEYFDLRNARKMRQAYGGVVQQLLTAGMEQRTEILQQVKAQLQPAKETPQLTLDWNDVRQIKERFPQFALGLHTRDHLDLTKLDAAAIDAEIRQCQSDYEQELGASAKYFSYPYGRNSSIVRESVRKLGFDGAVITQPTAMVSSMTDPYALPRFETSPSMLDLKLWLTGALPDLARNLFGRVYE